MSESMHTPVAAVEEALSPNARRVWAVRRIVLGSLARHSAEIMSHEAVSQDCGRGAAQYAFQLALSLATHGAIPNAIPLTSGDIFDLAKAFCTEAALVCGGDA